MIRRYCSIHITNYISIKSISNQSSCHIHTILYSARSNRILLRIWQYKTKEKSLILFPLKFKIKAVFCSLYPKHWVSLFSISVCRAAPHWCNICMYPPTTCLFAVYRSSFLLSFFLHLFVISCFFVGLVLFL